MTSIQTIDRLADDIAAAGVSGIWVTRNGIEKMPDFKGAYILALQLGETINVELPRAIAGQLAPSGAGLFIWKLRISRHRQLVR